MSGRRRDRWDVELMRLGKNADFEPELARARTDARTMCVWYCGAKSFEFLERFPKVEKLRIAGWVGSDLTALRWVPQLEELSICHMPQVTSLAGFPVLEKLRDLDLHTLPSEDPKKRPIDSWEPLTRLPQLRKLFLHGFKPQRDGIGVFANAPKLEDLSIDDVYPMEDCVTLKRRCPNLKGGWGEPIAISDYACEKCQGGKRAWLLGLHGTRRRSYVCTQCNADLVERHKQAWNVLMEAGARARAN